MTLSVIYNGQELNELIDVEKGFNPFSGSEWKVDLKERESADGSLFLYSKRNIKTINMPFRMKGDISTNYDKLQTILNVSEPQKLIFGNMSDRYFEAIPSGSTDFKESATNLIGHGEITWIVPNGVAESIDVTPFVAKVDSETGVMTAEVNNDGSAEVYPVYRIKHKTENGYIGIVHNGGAFEMGNIEEVDTEDYQKSEMLLNSINQMTGTLSTNPQNPTFLNAKGTLALNSQGRLYLSSKGSNDSNKWNGGMKVFTLPPDSAGVIGAKNFYSYFRLAFETTRVTQTGIIQVMFLDKDDNFICAYGAQKTSTSSNSASCSAWTKDKGTFWNTTFTPSSNANQNPFANAQPGHCDMLKQGNKVQVHWSQTYPSIINSSIEIMEVAKVAVYIGQFGTRTLDTNQFMSYNHLKLINGTKHNVSLLRDIPNSYSENSEVKIDCDFTNPNIRINGLPRNEEFVDGSDYYSLPTGKTKIEFYFSDWIKEMPEVTVEIRKRWG